MKPTDALIARAYETYRDRVTHYICSRINDEETARDLTQEVFMRLLEYSQLIYESAIENFIYTIARNLINDHLRRYYVRREYDRYVQDYAVVADNSVEDTIAYRDLASLERKCVESLTAQRATIYRLKRFEELSAKEISDQLGLSIRTVENHYYVGLKHVRNIMAQCI